LGSIHSRATGQGPLRHRCCLRASRDAVFGRVETPFYNPLYGGARPATVAPGPGCVCHLCAFSGAHFSVRCPACRSTDVERRESLTFNDQYKKDMATWTIIGKVRVHYCEHNQCRNCGSAKRLSCRVEEMTAEIDSWRFVIGMKCAVCGILGSLLELVPRLSNIKRLKIAWMGIEFEKQHEKSRTSRSARSSGSAPQKKE
jgi:hypothetical protein